MLFFPLFLDSVPTVFFWKQQQLSPMLLYILRLYGKGSSIKINKTQTVDIREVILFSVFPEKEGNKYCPCGHVYETYTYVSLKIHETIYDYL